MWSEAQPDGNLDLSWTPSAISSDGQKMIVGVQNGGIYISSNGGNTWSEIFPTGVDDGPDWYTANMSPDGQTIMVGVYAGRLYKSTDGGENWIEMQPAGDQDESWFTTSMSSDGLVFLAGIRNGRLYKSVNGGNTWSETRPAGNTDEVWAASAMSSDGQKMIAGYQGRIYLSTDKGDTWTEMQPAGDQDVGWQVAAMSPNGEVILVGTNDQLFLSKNGSDTWSEAQPAGDTYKLWRIASISSDGKTLYAGSSERLYLSDTGDTWSETQPAGDVNKDWTLGSMSSDSHTLLAGVYGGRLYVGSNPTPTPTPTSGGGESQNNTSNTNSSPTSTCVTQPTGAPDLFQINTTKNSANLFFSPVANTTNYNVSYGFNSLANQFSVLTNQGASSGVLSFFVGSLPANATVYFRVYAQNNCGQGNWSNSMQVVTNGKVYYENLVSQFLSIFPKPTTVIGAKTQEKVLGARTACVTYIVKSGDSLWSIAKEMLGNGSAYHEIQAKNSLSSSALHVGQKLLLGC